MNDNDLDALKSLDIPAPSSEAKARAMQSGLAAFRENSAAQAAAKKIEKNAQGKSGLLRLISTCSHYVGDIIMRNRLIASTIAVSALAIGVMFLPIWQETQHSPIIAIQPDATIPTDSTPTQMDSPSDVVENAESEPQMSRITEPTTRQEPAPWEIPPDESTADFIPDAVQTDMALTELTIDQMSEPSFTPTAEIALNNKTVAKNSPAMSPLTASDQATRTNTVAQAKHAPQPALASAEQNTLVRSSNAIEAEIRSIAQPSHKPHLNKPHITTPYGQPGTPIGKIDQTKTNPTKTTREHPVSTFSIDVDTANYAMLRRSLNQGRIPSAETIRIEELINYFDYDYEVPADAETPFKPTIALYPTPWNPDTKLLHIGIKGHELTQPEKPSSNLVFLVDVSGSMNQADKLPLLQTALRMLVNTLKPTDRVAIVTYAGHAGTILDPTPAKEKDKIFAALEQMRAGGGTWGAQGIEQAYRLAKQNFVKDGVNRVILATDGDFNVGATRNTDLKTLIEQKREEGIYLSILGFGQGNYNDSLMQTLAQSGNGNAAYIDTLNETRKVLVDEASSTLFPIANDVKIQIEFNPALVAEYRLIGYETRALQREDFNNDKVDAGDIGAGHSVTALYEIIPVNSPAIKVDPLRYQSEAQQAQLTTATNQTEYAYFKLRYKMPGESKSKLIQVPIKADLTVDSLSELNTDIQFAAAVAAFGQRIRQSLNKEEISYNEILQLASSAKGDDTFGYRAEFINLIRLTQSISGE